MARVVAIFLLGLLCAPGARADDSKHRGPNRREKGTEGIIDIRDTRGKEGQIVSVHID